MSEDRGKYIFHLRPRRPLQDACFVQLIVQKCKLNREK